MTFLPAEAETNGADQTDQADREDQALAAIFLANVVQRHKRAEFKTDEHGAAKLKAIRVGEYYLFGIKRIGDQILVWHALVQIKPGANRLAINRSNAATVFAVE